MNPTGSAVVLSGGLDSTVCMALAARDPSPPAVAVTFDYGQKSRTEIVAARRVAEHYECEHLVVPLDTRPWGGSALVDDAVEIPSADAGHDGSPTSDAIPATYVPARNIIFLSVGLGIAEARDLAAIYIGVNALDYSGYPDCRPEFVDAFRRVAMVGQKRGVEGNPVDIRTPLISLTKAEIVSLGVSLGAPLELTWSCYRSASRPCGHCESCVLRAKGFAQAGVADPALSPEGA